LDTLATHQQASSIKAVTDNLPDSGALSGLSSSVVATETQSQANASTLTLVLADTDELQSAGLAATLSTLSGYVDTEVSAIKAVTDNLPDSGALTTLAQASNLGVINSEVFAISSAVGVVDTQVQANASNLTVTYNELLSVASVVAVVLADTGTDGVVISSATKVAIADALLNRDMSAVTDSNSRTPLNALRFLRNKWQVTSTTLSVKKEDDTTEAWNATVTADASANPITGSDPA
jgi:hypothetical protein